MYDTKRLSHILSDILSSKVKQDDAPCSSDAHLYRAIYELSQMVPDYRPPKWDVEGQELLDEAKEFMSISLGLSCSL